jgi:hypothetical protein
MDGFITGKFPVFHSNALLSTVIPIGRVTRDEAVHPLSTVPDDDENSGRHECSMSNSGQQTSNVQQILIQKLA